MEILMNDATEEIIERAKSDPAFLHQLIFSPGEAIKGLRLTDEERAAITATTPEGLINSIVNLRGCGNTGTCTITCKVTCKVTFGSAKVTADA
jgi:hypothetical protein